GKCEIFGLVAALVENFDLAAAPRGVALVPVAADFADSVGGGADHIPECNSFSRAYAALDYRASVLACVRVARVSMQPFAERAAAGASGGFLPRWALQVQPSNSLLTPLRRQAGWGQRKTK